MAKRRTVAQAGRGDPDVIAGPGYRKIPTCKFKLKTKAGRDEYSALARKLFDAGRLDEDAHFNASAAARIVDQIESLEESGKEARASWFAQLRQYRKALNLDGLDAPIAAPVEAPRNRFARRGLPNGCQR